MGDIRNFKDLIAWQKSFELCKRVYAMTQSFPRDELFGLSLQLKRAAVSVAANIAEGWGRGYLNDYVRFLRTARGSACELETEVLVARDLGYATAKVCSDVLGMIEESVRVLQGLISSLERLQDKKANSGADSITQPEA